MRLHRPVKLLAFLEEAKASLPIEDAVWAVVRVASGRGRGGLWAVEDRAGSLAPRAVWPRGRGACRATDAGRGLKSITNILSNILLNTLSINKY